MSGIGAPASIPPLSLLETDSVGASGEPAPLPHLALVLNTVPGAGTLTKTLDALTAAGTATVEVSGAVTKTLAAIAFTSTGTLGSNSGSISAPVSLPHLSLVMYGIAGIWGVTTQTLEDMTCLSDGEVPGGEIWAYEDEDKPARAPIYWPHSYNVDWFQTDTVVRGDTGGLVGTVGQDLLPLTCFAQATANAVASLTQTLADLTVVASGQAGSSGTLSYELEALTCSSSADVSSDKVATAFNILDALTVVSTARVGISCSLTKTLDDVTCVASSVNEISGSFSNTLQNINVEIEGIVLSDIVGTAWIVLDDMTCAAHGNIDERRRQDGGIGRGKGGRKRKYLVDIDGEEFIVESAEDAQALLNAVEELSEQKAKEEAGAVVERRFAIAKASGKVLDVSPIDLEQPRAISDSEALQDELNAIITAAYQRAEVEAEIAVRLAKQRLEDEEDNLVLLLLND